jgi:DNA-binding GntR family transcriptional regulator
MPVKGDFNVPLRDFQKLIELREILERGVSRLAAMNITEEQIRDLERLSEMAHHINREDISELINYDMYDMQFHQIINQASHNHYLQEYISVTQNQFFRIQRLISHEPERMLADLPKVIEALKGRDADQMEQLMVEHVEHFASAVGRYFSSGR